MEPGKKSIVRAIINTAKAHVIGTFRTIKENATEVAENEYGVKLNLAKPKLHKIVDDLKEWNENRKEEARLSREEMKQIVHGVVSETKRVIANPDDVRDEDMDELNDLMASLEMDLEDDLNDIDGMESDDFNRDNLPTVELEAPHMEKVNIFLLGVIMSLDKNERFTNYVHSNYDHIKEILCIEPESSEDIVCTQAIDAGHDYVTPNEEFINEVVEEIENSNTNVNLDIAINAEEIGEVIGTESEANTQHEDIHVFIRTELLRAYQRNEIFSSTLDRVMTMLNKVIMNYEEQSGDDIKQGLNILSANPTIYQIIDIFEFNILDAVSFFAIFMLFGDQETDYLETLETAIVKLSNSLDGISQIVE